MGLFERLERSLERAVNGAFAKAFKSSVQPVEIASAMRRAMDDRAAATSRTTGKTVSQAVVPNMFTVELSTKDYDDLTAYADDLTDELLASAEEHIDSQRYRVAGPMRIVFAENTDLETGVFTLRPASSRRPFDIAPAGLADRKTADHADYEEYAELSMGLPVVSKDDAQDEPAPQRPDDEPRAWATDDHQDREARAPRGERPGWITGAKAAATGAAAAAAAKASGAAAAATGFKPKPAAPPAPTHAPHELPVPRRERRPEPAPAPAPQPEATQVHEQPAPVRPAAVKRPWLDIDGDRYPLLGAITVVGRDHSSDIVLDDPGISRKHAEIRVTFDGPHPVITLIDLGSTNGVFVNGERTEQAHVADGDRITLGRSSMVLRTGR